MRETKWTRGLTLTPKATISLAEIGAEVSAAKEFATEDCFPVATGRDESVVEWLFLKTEAVTLEGMECTTYT